ncbi:hypothetical protein [Nocardia harenae]|uniref:hypothetical protein n=1 Tax=Nocardia harenae TaxID=358707 RepID=UPI0012EEC6B8|nr:hypothetical protein [Nocardia harenae]
MRARLWAIAAGAAILLTGCGASASDPALVNSPTPALGGGFGGLPAAGTHDPGAVVTDPASGLRIAISSVEAVPSIAGTVTVLHFRFENPGRDPLPARGWTAPVLTYGPSDMPAAHVVSVSEGYGADVPGALAPGASQELKHAYRVNRAELTSARVSAGSVIWEGDFTR